MAGGWGPRAPKGEVDCNTHGPTSGPLFLGQRPVQSPRLHLKTPGFRAAGLATWWASVQPVCPVCNEDDKPAEGGAAGTLGMRGLGSGSSAGGPGQAASHVGWELNSPG